MASVTLLDGGLGQEINARAEGPAHALWSVKVMMEHPEIVADVHRAYIDAGADAICINAYTATRPRLELNGFPQWFDDAQRLAREIILKSRADAGAEGRVQITSCLPPLFASYVTEAAGDYQTSYDLYKEITDLQAPHVDVMFIETIGIIEEARAAMDAAKTSGKAVYMGFTINDDMSNTLRSGEALEDAVAAAVDAGVDGVMINCSIPEAVTKGMPVLAQSGLRFGGYANGFTSIAKLTPGANVDLLEARKDLGPEAYAGFVKEWLDLGATIIGGCCEVGPQHIHYLNEMLNKEGYTRIPL